MKILKILISHSFIIKKLIFFKEKKLNFSLKLEKKKFKEIKNTYTIKSYLIIIKIQEAQIYPQYLLLVCLGLVPH